MSTQEIIIFENNDIKVTNLRAVFGTKTYAIANITSVEAKRQNESSCLPVGLILAGILGIMIGFGNLGNDMWWMMIPGAAICVAGFNMARAQKPTYVVQISSASGEIKAYVSQDKSYIDKIVEALNTAIIQKR